MNKVAITTTIAVAVVTLACVASAAHPMEIIHSKLKRARTIGGVCGRIKCAGQGEKCGYIEEQNATYFCKAPLQCIPGGGWSVERTCMWHFKEGEQCTADLDCCDNGFFQDVGLICRNSKCTKRAAEGQACQSMGDCARDLECIGGECRDPHVGGVGDGCSYDGQCKRNLLCSMGKCAEMPTYFDTCINHVCRVDFNCMKEICIPWFSSPEGAFCGTNLDCAEGLACGNNGICLVPTSQPTQIPCTRDFECNTDSRCKCNPDTGVSTCIPREPVTAAYKGLYNSLTKCVVQNEYHVQKCEDLFVAFGKVSGIDEAELAFYCL